MGAVFKIPIIQNADLEYITSVMKSKNINVYAAHLKGNTYHYDLDLKGGCAFMLGNEARGLSDKAAKMCDRLLVKDTYARRSRIFECFRSGGSTYI
ncbi:MAG: TrmH family RNA methyltransferase [Veillonella parvula]